MSSELDRLRDHYGGLRVLVTGANGFKGTWLTALLDALGAEVVASGWDPPSQPHLWGRCRGLGYTLDRTDLRDWEATQRLLVESKPDCVLHLGAQALVGRGLRQPVATYEANSLGTAHLLQAIHWQGSVRAAVVVTTDKVYEPSRDRAHREGDALGAIGPYSASKVCAEAITQAAQCTWASDRGLGLATARAGNVVGGGDWADDRLLPDCIRAIQDGTILRLRHPEAIRPWQYVLDVLWGYLLLGEALVRDSSAHSGPWNFAPLDGEGQGRVEDVVKLLFQHLGAVAPIEVLESSSDHVENPILRLSGAKARERLGWLPRLDLAAAIERTARWHRAAEEGRELAELTREEVEDYLSRLA